MRITCPRCGHSREIDEQRVPAGENRVTCPLCRQQFFIHRPGDNSSPAENQESAPRQPEAGTPPPSPAMPEPLFRRTPRPEKEPEPAGFWIRVTASVVDSVAAGMLQIGLFLLFPLVVGQLDAVIGAEIGDDALRGLNLWLACAVGIAYPVFFIGYCGQTPGKMALRVKVVRNDGEGIGFFRALLRETVGKFLSAALLGVGFLMVGFTRQKRGLHDLVAGSRVIKLN